MEIVHGVNFTEKGFVSHAHFMDATKYAEALDCLVLSCVDIVVVNEWQDVLLGKRHVDPCPDWYIMGGRMRPGESFEQTAVRNIKRELGLEINPSRFKYLCSYSSAWAKRAQPPTDHGSHTTSIVMILELSEKEMQGIAHNEEYEEIMWVELEQVRLPYSSFHPIVKLMAENAVAKLQTSALH